MIFNFPEAHNHEKYEQEKLRLLQVKLGMITDKLALPLFLIFWICDLVYAPQFKWEFLTLRVAIIPLHLFANKFSKKAVTLRHGEWISLLLIVVYSAIINTMIALLNDYSSPYYAGLNLIAIGTLTFVPWRLPFFMAANFVLFLPYYLSFLVGGNYNQFNFVLVNTFFIVGTIVITSAIRFFHEALQIREFNNRLQLQDELDNRESIIREKTKEGLRLANLSSQFSPQVIEAIKQGNRLIDTKKRNRAEICAIFIDAVSSTERLVRLDHRHFIEAIEDFMELSINTLLKYDLTIDKFYGDGVLAFSNDPVRRPDFIERTCKAAIDIRNQVLEKQTSFRKIWQKDFNITIGIASGYASVGFYGNRTYIKQYSAIGPCLALSQRLSSIAGPNEILVDQHIQTILEKANFQTSKKGDFTLKGFGDDQFEVYNVLSSVEEIGSNSYSVECEKCHENSVFLDESEGIYILKCRKCGYVSGNSDTEISKKRAS